MNDPRFTKMMPFLEEMNRRGLQRQQEFCDALPEGAVVETILPERSPLRQTLREQDLQPSNETKSRQNLISVFLLVAALILLTAFFLL